MNINVQQVEYVKRNYRFMASVGVTLASVETRLRKAKHRVRRSDLVHVFKEAISMDIKTDRS